MFKKAALSVLLFIFPFAGFTFGQDKSPAAAVPLKLEPWVLHQSLTHQVLPEYPASARAGHVEGDVFVDVVVNEDGKIQEAVAHCPYCSPPVLNDAAVAAVKKWEYQPILKDEKPVPVSSYIAFRFRLEKEPVVEILTKSESSTPARLGPHSMNQLTGGVVGGINGTSNPPPRVARPQKIKVSARVAQEHLIHKVEPEYRLILPTVPVQGDVTLLCVISKQGDVESCRTLFGHPVLAQVALVAVRQWKYSPFLLDGNPVEAETQITVPFSHRMTSPP